MWPSDMHIEIINGFNSILPVTGRYEGFIAMCPRVIFYS
jgi:hypothetical protein